jgi:cytochrome b6-f complex iron-sulfur subunit
MPDDNTEEQEQPPEKAPATRPGAPVAAGAGGHQVVVAQPAPVAGRGPALPKVSRRNVVIIGFWAGMGAILASIAATILNNLWPRNVTGFGSTVFVGTVDQFGVGTKTKNVEAKAWIVRLSAEQAERNGGQEGAFLALYQKCPHLGCSVPWRPDYSREDPRSGQRYAGWFLCPCHGSTYSDAGVRVFGPAPRSMDTFAVTIDGGNINVNTGDITPGTVENGSRGVLPG